MLITNFKTSYDFNDPSTHPIFWIVKYIDSKKKKQYIQYRKTNIFLVGMTPLRIKKCLINEYKHE